MNAETASRLIKTLRQITEALEQLLPAVSHHPTCKVSKGGVKCNCRVHGAVLALQQGKEVLDLVRPEETGADWVLGAMKQKTQQIMLVPQEIEPQRIHGVNWGAPGIVLLRRAEGRGRLVWRAGHIDSHRGERTYHHAELQLRGINKRGEPDLLGFDFNELRPEGPAKMSQALLTNSVQWIARAFGYKSLANLPFGAVSLYEAFRNKKTIVLLDNEKGKS